MLQYMVYVKCWIEPERRILFDVGTEASIELTGLSTQKKSLRNAEPISTRKHFGLGL